jgi:hypothetical protein
MCARRSARCTNGRTWSSSLTHRRFKIPLSGDVARPLRTTSGGAAETARLHDVRFRHRLLPLRPLPMRSVSPLPSFLLPRRRSVPVEDRRGRLRVWVGPLAGKGWQGHALRTSRTWTAQRVFSLITHQIHCLNLRGVKCFKSFCKGRASICRPMLRQILPAHISQPAFLEVRLSSLTR